MTQKTKSLLMAVSEPLFVFGIGGPFMYFFTRRVGLLLIGPMESSLTFAQKLGFLFLSEVGVLIGCAYATVLWILTMRLFFEREEIESRLTEDYVPFVSEAVLKIFRFVCAKPS